MAVPIRIDSRLDRRAGGLPPFRAESAVDPRRRVAGGKRFVGCPVDDVERRRNPRFNNLNRLIENSFSAPDNFGDQTDMLG